MSELDAKALLQKHISEQFEAWNVADAGTIDAHDAGFVWDLNPDGRYFGTAHDLRVVDLPKVRDETASEEDIHAWKTGRATLGACMSGWMQHPRYTPEGIFAKLTYNRDIVGKEDFAHIVREFSKIRECEWARIMLAALFTSDYFEGNEGRER